MSSPSLPFSTLCDFLSSLRKIKPTKAKQSTKQTNLAARAVVLKLFSDWIESGFNDFYSTKEDAPEGTSVILFRLLFPDEGVRRRYDLREATLAKELIKSSCFKKALKPSFATDWDHGEIEVERSDCSGCLGIELQEKLEKEGRSGGDITIVEIDTLLDELASSSRYSSVARKDGAPRRTRHTILHELFYRLTPSEAGFMTQIILRDLTPILYPPPSRLRGDSLNMYNSLAYYKFTLQDALRIWHPRLSEMYRFSADLDLVLRRIDRGDATPRIDLFTPCHVAKTTRPGTTKAAMKNLQGMNSVEVKYDGFRMQIHFDSTKPSESQLQIFSKSTRNSTDTREQSHPILRAAFGQARALDQIMYPHLHQRIMESLPSSSPRDTIQSGIFEAEMICYSELKGGDELFHKLADALAGREMLPRKGDSQASTESSIQTGQSSMEMMNRRFEKHKRSQQYDLHLKIVFFDVLYLDGESLIDETYELRRNRLENLIRPIRNYSMIAERKLIDFGDLHSDRARGLMSLRRFLAETIVNRGEGLMIKNIKSIPHSYKSGFRTVKLKKDFIPGCGDTLDFVILGARWDRDRGRELGVPPSVLTTFFVGLLVDGGGRKKYAVQFATSYGLSRAELQQLNNLVAAHHQPQRFAPEKGATVHTIDNYSFTLAEEVASPTTRPTFMFRTPLVVELNGAGFQRSTNKVYSLRWPRISKFLGREMNDAVTLSQMEDIGEKAMQIDNGEEDSYELEKQGKKVSRNEEILGWIQKLERADGVEESKLSQLYHPDEPLRTFDATPSFPFTPPLSFDSSSMPVASFVIPPTPGPSSERDALLGNDDLHFQSTLLADARVQADRRKPDIVISDSSSPCRMTFRKRRERTKSAEEVLVEAANELPTPDPSSDDVVVLASLSAASEPSCAIAKPTSASKKICRHSSLISKEEILQKRSPALRTILGRQNSLPVIPSTPTATPVRRPPLFWTVFPSSFDNEFFATRSTTAPDYNKLNYCASFTDVCREAGWKGKEEDFHLQSARPGRIFVKTQLEVDMLWELIRRNFELPMRFMAGIVADVEVWKLEGMEKGKKGKHFRWS